MTVKKAWRRELEVSACPFCDSVLLELSGDVALPDDAKLNLTFWVTCKDEDCRATGPAARDRQGAVDAWNRRARKPTFCPFGSLLVEFQA